MESTPTQYPFDSQRFTSLPFRERLQASIPIIADGSMATELAKRGRNEVPAELYNLKDPVIVETIHRDFIAAGARLVQSNTVGANRIALERWNIADKAYEINRKGVWAARTAALHQAYVAGAIGPVGKFLFPLGKILAEDVRRAFIDQAIALIDGGADAIILKSFIDINEIEIAIDAVRYVDSAIPIIALKTFPEDGEVLSTDYPQKMAERLKNRGADVVGTNGTVGPQRMISIVEAFKLDDIPLCSLPDVGIPTLVEGKATFSADPEYVAASVQKITALGAIITGADGGATVEHIRAIASAVKDIKVGEVSIAPRKIKVLSKDTEPTDEMPLFRKHLRKKFLSTVELDVPRGLDISSIIDGAKYLQSEGIDAVNISDGARARLRMSPIAIAHQVQTQVGIEAITHLSCRDRNMVGLQAELLGAYSLGVKNILAITGDPAQIGDYPYATSVYDVDAIGLIRAVNRMNSGEDLMGNPIGRPTQFSISCACNPVADDISREVERLERKVEEGAQAIFTQPIFDFDTFFSFLQKVQHLETNFLIGIIPLRTYRHAQFLHYEVPGMFIPQWVRERMKKYEHDAESASKEGIDIAVEFLSQARQYVAGAYLMPPFKKYSMAVDILKQIA